MRRSSRAAVQDSSKATVSLRNQDLHVKAQPKQPRVPRVQKRDRLLDVPLTQEWLASSGQMTSCAKQPGSTSSGHEKPQPKVLFRDHEQVWAKVRLPRGICVAPLTHWPGSRVKLPPSPRRSRGVLGGPPSSVPTPTATPSVGASTTSPFLARTKRRATACQTTCATSSSTWATSTQA